jgi:hypothetical protein
VTGSVYDARFHLLDRQVIGPNDEQICKIDDLELMQTAPGQPYYVTAILAGPAALGPRIGGPIGRFMVRLRRRLHPSCDAEPPRVAWAVVSEIASAVRIVLQPSQTEVRSLEDWLRRHLIDHIPGAGDAPE